MLENRLDAFNCLRNSAVAAERPYRKVETSELNLSGKATPGVDVQIPRKTRCIIALLIGTWFL